MFVNVLVWLQPRGWQYQVLGRQRGDVAGAVQVENREGVREAQDEVDRQRQRGGPVCHSADFVVSRIEETVHRRGV